MTPRFRGLRVLLVAIFYAALTSPASAANRRLIGRVTDAAGQPIAGVAVTLVNAGGPAPEMQTDRSAINSEGAGRNAYAAHNALPWTTYPVGATPGEDPTPLTKVTSNDDGAFSFATHEYVAALGVKLEREGFATSKSVIPFKLGSTQHTFVLHAAGTDEARAADAAEAAQAFDAGVAHTAKRDWPAARDAFARVVELTPEAHQAWLNLAIAQLELNDFEAALASAQRVLTLAPEVEIAKTIVADTQARLGRGGAAAAAQPAAAEAEAEADPAVAARLAYNDGAALLKSGDQRAAIARFTAALAHDPTLVDAHFALGLTHASLGETADARTHLDRFLELAPSHPKAARAKQVRDELGN